MKKQKISPIEIPFRTRKPTTEIKSINVSPTWLGILPFLLEVAVNGNKKNKKWAESELRRMAVLADLHAGNRDTL